MEDPAISLSGSFFLVVVDREVSAFREVRIVGSDDGEETSFVRLHSSMQCELIRSLCLSLVRVIDINIMLAREKRDALSFLLLLLFFFENQHLLIC